MNKKLVKYLTKDVSPCVADPMEDLGKFIHEADVKLAIVKQRAAKIGFHAVGDINTYYAEEWTGLWTPDYDHPLHDEWQEILDRLRIEPQLLVGPFRMYDTGSSFKFFEENRDS